MTAIATPSRPHQVTSKTVEVGDVLQQGFGTLTITTREVAAVERWITWNGYTNAVVTFTNGDTETLWADTHVSNLRFYEERDGLDGVIDAF